MRISRFEMQGKKYHYCYWFAAAAAPWAKVTSIALQEEKGTKWHLSLP